MNKTITVSEFCEIIKNDIDKFELMYETSRSENPEEYPIEMSEGDWLEQLLMYLDL